MGPMRTPEQHHAEVKQLLDDCGALHRSRHHEVALSESLGATLAADMVAAYDSPRFDNSQMDGYALPTAAGGTFTVGATIPAGTDPDRFYADGLGGQAAPIMTGAKVPRGTAAIVPVERTEPADFLPQGATVTAPAVPEGQFVRAAGSDISRGSTLVTGGTRINAAVIATLAGQDIPTVNVVAPARIVICTGGAEIGSSSTDLADRSAAIPDSNGPMLTALAAEAGIVVAGHVRTDDDPVKLRRDLDTAIAELQPDAIVTSGGISAGKFEVVRQVLEPHGWFGHVDQQPGGPQGLAKLSGTPVICLPGNPISSLVSFHLYVADLLGTTLPALPAQLAHPVTGLDDRERFLRGHMTIGADAITASQVGGPGSHLVAQAIGADCLIRIPIAAELDAGAQVTIYPL